MRSASNTYPYGDSGWSVGCPYGAAQVSLCVPAAFARYSAAVAPLRVGQKHHHVPVEFLGYSQAPPESSYPAFNRYYEPTKTT